MASTVFVALAAFVSLYWLSLEGGNRNKAMHLQSCSLALLVVLLVLEEASGYVYIPRSRLPLRTSQQPSLQRYRAYLPPSLRTPQFTIHATPPKNPPPPSDSTWLSSLVLPLWFIYVSNQWSRSSLYYVVDFSDTATEATALNIALNLNEAQYAILASVAFTSLFAVASVVLGNVRTVGSNE